MGIITRRVGLGSVWFSGICWALVLLLRAFAVNHIFCVVLCRNTTLLLSCLSSATCLVGGFLEEVESAFAFWGVGDRARNCLFSCFSSTSHTFIPPQLMALTPSLNNTCTITFPCLRRDTLKTTGDLYDHDDPFNKKNDTCASTYSTVHISLLTYSCMSYDTPRAVCMYTDSKVQIRPYVYMLFSLGGYLD